MCETRDKAAANRIANKLDLEPADRLAISMCRQSIELAGAAVGAIAVNELTSLDGPFGVRHGRLLTGTLGEVQSTQPRWWPECYQASASLYRSPEKRQTRCFQPALSMSLA